MDSTVIEKITSSDYQLSDTRLSTKVVDEAIETIDLKLIKNSEIKYEDGYDFSFLDKKDSDILFNNKLHALNNRNFNTYREYYKEAQNWVGHIIELKEDSFVAKLEDLHHPATYEIASFDFNDVSPEDKKLIGLGNVFYWSVGYAVRNSQVIKESFIRFQRLPSWTVAQFDTIADNARSLSNSLKWD
ncbi:hypothetical protein FO440_24055 [Mucilaginibacter corticis]|uniref:Uncharacterized protein n=1 Tax=Mucilaginibacter corticis TaxID=2597670 RepID=A0A556M4Y9_9SPHI|nr:hypothetical protein [Mucilaginibacter corticis]TSJ34916.1 hypothetical protein FO440_24055 [Mucilaginibacter corticis]